MPSLISRGSLVARYLLLLTLCDCAATSEPANGSTDGGAAADTSVAQADSGSPIDTGSAAVDTGTAADTGSAADTATVSDVSLASPVIIDDSFAPSGYMGDGEMAGPIAMIPASATDSTDCNGARSSTSAKGICHQVTYTPPTSGGKGWAGVYWQYPANNWGTKPGYPMPPGAKKVSFFAKGAKGGEKVTFLAGGIAPSGAAHQDGVSAKTEVTLTADWAPYSIDISGQMYTEVLGGFGWTMAGTDATPSGKFYVDDIRWE